jgi:hypothetical protein
MDFVVRGFEFDPSDSSQNNYYTNDLSVPTGNGRIFEKYWTETYELEANEFFCGFEEIEKSGAKMTILIRLVPIKCTWPSA